MRLRIHNIMDVAETQNCCGCGACAYLEPNLLGMSDVLDHGRRPLLRSGIAAQSTRSALKACPGAGLAHGREQPRGVLPELLAAWGPVLEVWEGFAGDREIRFSGSSGGAATALSLFALEVREWHGVLHIASREDVPYLNETVLSRTRGELERRTGSRYAPASPCDGLALIEDAEGPCVFIGKPCDVAGARRAAELRPRLEANLGLTIAIFCAGTPSTRGTLEMLSVMGIHPADALSVRYRGNGWPGNAVATAGAGRRAELTYQESWGAILSRHVQWRCRVCPDHTGEFADISVGDPWYRPVAGGDPGRSLLVARTERGRQFVRDAVAAGYLVAEPADPGIIAASQPNLAAARGAVWGRLLALRAMGLPTPRFRRMPMFHLWLAALSARGKARSVFGTFKRVIRKRLWKRARLEPFLALPAHENSSRSEATVIPPRLAVPLEGARCGS